MTPNPNHTSNWVVCFPAAYAEHLGQLRLVPGLKVLVQDGLIWLRGHALDQELGLTLRKIPDSVTYSVHTSGKLTRDDETVPSAEIPEGPWQLLWDWHELKLPRAGFAARLDQPVVLRLVRSSLTTPINALRTTWKIWQQYVISAPQIRIDRFAFAMSERSEVLVRGTPLPPLPGRSYFESNGLFLPVGWRLDPDVGTAVARQVMKLDPETLAIFLDEGTFERIPQSSFVRASRAAVRASHER